MLGIERDDLRRAEILGPKDARSNAALAGETDMLGTDTQHEIALGATLYDAGNGNDGAIQPDRLITGRKRTREAQEIHRRRADEVRHEHCGRPIVDFLRRTELLDHT